MGLPAPSGWSRMWERAREDGERRQEGIQKAQPCAACPLACSPPPLRRSHTQIKHARKFLPAQGSAFWGASHRQEKKKKVKVKK